jgi:hypothetical protein
LARRLCHALGIAERAIECLAQDGYVDAEEPGNSIRPEKVISETAFLLLAASTVSSEFCDVAERIGRIARLLIPYARSERMLLQMCLHPSLALDFAQAHICLGRLGYRDEGFDSLLRASCQAQSSLGRERVPHRVLEQEWLGKGWNGFQPDSPWRSSRTRFKSALHQPTDLLGGSREDAYAFTHALMYMRDFNIQPLALPRRRGELLAEAEAMLARCLDEQDYDLCGELLLAWPLTGKSWSSPAAFGFRVLTKIEDEAGFLPAASTRLQRIAKLHDDERDRYLLGTAYHTIYVMGLLCAISLQPGRTPPVFMSSTASTRGASRLILQHLDSDGQKGHWREVLETLTDQAQDAVSGLLLDIAVLRAVKRHQLGKVRELLEIGEAFGLSDAPCLSQAAETLGRLAMFARITQLNYGTSDETTESSLRRSSSGIALDALAV